MGLARVVFFILRLNATIDAVIKKGR